MNAIKIEIMESGRVVAVENSALVFGRSRSADVQILDDRLISSKHFQISLDGGLPLLIDLGSTNGTLINGRQVQTARLYHGDVIEAGSTHLQVDAAHLPPVPPDSATNRDSQFVKDLKEGVFVSGGGGAQESAGRSGTVYFNPFESYHGPRGKLTASGDGDDVTLPARRQQIIETTRSLTDSGLVRLQAQVEDASEIVEVVTRFVQLGGLYLIADYGRLGLAAPDSLDLEETCLFDWLPPSAGAQLPIVIPLDDSNDWKTLIEDGWGGDALEIVHTNLEKAEFIQVLRKLLRGSSKEKDQSRGVRGFCWPSVLTSMLENDTNSFAGAFMKDVDFAIVESANEKEGWQLYANEETVNGIGALGFQVVDFDAEGTIESESVN